MFGRTNGSEDEEESCMSTTRGDGLRTGEVPVGAGASLQQGRRRESTGTNAPETMFTSADLRGVDTGSNLRRVQAVKAVKGEMDASGPEKTYMREALSRTKAKRAGKSKRKGSVAA